jgi:hypothetical protein
MADIRIFKEARRLAPLARRDKESFSARWCLSLAVMWKAHHG